MFSVTLLATTRLTSSEEIEDACSVRMLLLQKSKRLL